MKIRDANNELIEWTDYHHHPMHEAGGVDAIGTLGSIQLNGTLTVGVDDTGYDVKFFGATSGVYFLWDESEDTLKVTGGKVAFGGNTDWGTGATGTQITGAGYDWVTQTVGRVNANLNGTAAAAAYHAMSITANQTSSNSIFGTWTELYVSNSVDLTGADNFAAIWGQFEAGTGVTLSDTGCFTAGVYANVKAGATLTVPAGHSLNGFRAQLEVAAVTNNGNMAAFECLKSGGVDWEYGLYLANVTTDIRFQEGTTLTDDGTDLTLAGANLVLGDNLTVGGTLGVTGNSTFSTATFNGLVTGIMASEIEVSEIGTATYDDVQDFINTTVSAGRTSGGAIEASGASGDIKVNLGTGFVKTTDSAIGDTKAFNWSDTVISAGASAGDIIDNDVNYIYIDYNAGTPVPKATTDRTAIEFNRMFTLGRVYRSGTTLHIVNTGIKLYNHTRDNHERLIQLRRFERASGGIITEDSGTDRALNCTAGIYFLGSGRVSNAQQDTANSDRFTYWYHSGGNWTSSANQQTVSNEQYDNGTALANLTGNRYGVFWVFVHFDGDLQVIYGRGNYTLSQAEDASLPDVPDAVSEFSILAAKIIVQHEGTNFKSIATAYQVYFPVTTPDDHNDMGNLQGGTTDEYYHLTSARHTLLATDLTATAAELNLLDLAGLATGSLLVATAAATAAWQSTGVVLTAPKISGAVTTDGLILPTFAMGGAAITGHAQAIADNAILTVDHVTPIATDYARFTANGLEGREASEVVSDIQNSLNKIVDPTDQDTLVEAEEDQVTMDVAGTEAFLLNDVGILDLAKQSRAKAYLGAAQQVIPTASYVKPALDTEVYDEQNEFDITLSSGTATATTADKLVDGNATFEADGIIVGAQVWNTTDNTYALVTAIDSETVLSIDTDIMADTEGYKVYNARFTASVAGYYAIVGGGMILNPAADTRMIIYVYKNGAVHAGYALHTSHVNHIQAEVPIVTNLAASDYVELYLYHDSGANRNLYNAERTTFLSVHKLS